jgi:flavin reductase (DIM6/NTAB) family NADH-FMN oxidoreductase RutF
VPPGVSGCHAQRPAHATSLRVPSCHGPGAERLTQWVQVALNGTVIDREIKRSLGQLMKGVEVVGAAHGGEWRAYTSHWVTQVSFEEPIVMASASRKHDTHPLMVDAGEFSVSILAGDQIVEGQYFSYPGRRLRRVATELLRGWPDDEGGPPVVPNAIAWLRCRTFQRMPMEDHDLFFARVVAVVPGRLREPPLLYSSRLGWRVAGDRAREPGVSVRDQLLARAGVNGLDGVDDDGT